MSDTLRDQLLGLGFKAPAKPAKPPPRRDERRGRPDERRGGGHGEPDGQLPGTGGDPDPGTGQQQRGQQHHTPHPDGGSGGVGERGGCGEGP